MVPKRAGSPGKIVVLGMGYGENAARFSRILAVDLRVAQGLNRGLALPVFNECPRFSAYIICL